MFMHKLRIAIGAIAGASVDRRRAGVWAEQSLRHRFPRTAIESAGDRASRSQKASAIHGSRARVLRRGREADELDGRAEVGSEGIGQSDQ